jgi:hypothetical protein
MVPIAFLQRHRIVLWLLRSVAVFRVKYVSFVSPVFAVLFVNDQLTCLIGKGKSRNEHIILFLPVKLHLWKGDMFTLCVLEGGWHKSVTNSRYLRGFCVGIATFMYGVPIIATFMYGVPMDPLEFTELQSSVNIRMWVTWVFSRAVFLKMQIVLDKNCERNGRTQVTGCGVC